VSSLKPANNPSNETATPKIHSALGHKNQLREENEAETTRTREKANHDDDQTLGSILLLIFSLD
jgi:hypothetical protein